MHKYRPANSITDGPIINLLTILYKLIEILSGVRAKGVGVEGWGLNDFEMWHFYGSFSERRRGKHGSGRVKYVPSVCFLMLIYGRQVG